jgi:hypothetical protein
MERFQSAQWIVNQFHQLPANVQVWLIQAFWIAVPVLVLIVGWRIVHQESVSESGRVGVVWYSPTAWSSRFQQLRDEGHAALPNVQRLVQQADRANALAHKLHTLLLGGLLVLFAVLMGIMWLVSPLQGWWAGLAAFAAGYFAKRLLRPSSSK